MSDKPFNAINGAAWLGAQHALEALIDFGVKTPSSALRWTASLNRIDCMRTISEKLGQNDFCDLQRLEGWSTALHRAALCWHVEAVELALGYITRMLGDSGSEDRSCISSALVSAVREYDCDDRCRWDTSRPGRQLRIMQNLITAGADVNWEEPEQWQSEHRPEPGLTAIWALVDVGMPSPKEEVLLLLSSGLQLDKTCTYDSQTPLFGLVHEWQDDTSLAKAFLEAGAKATVKDANLNTPLHFVGNRSFAELLFKHDADLFANNINTALYLLVIVRANSAR